MTVPGSWGSRGTAARRSTRKASGVTSSEFGVEGLRVVYAISELRVSGDWVFEAGDLGSIRATVAVELQG